MKKTNLKLFLITTFVLIGIFLLFFISLFTFNSKVLAQGSNDIRIITTGYSVISLNNYVLGGYYSDNFEKKGFTTYFEFKEDFSDLDIETDREETIKIIRETNIEESNVFYSNPELQLFSTYYFRAVGYFNDDPSQKFYGNVLNLRTGYIPIGITIPFTINQNDIVVPYIPPPTLDAFYAIPSLINYEGISTLHWSATNAISCTAGDAWSGKKTTLGNESTRNLTSTKIYTLKCEGLGGESSLESVTVTVNDQSTPPPALPKGEGDSGLVSCDGSTANPCGFDQFIELINKVMGFLFSKLIIPIAAILFAYAGFELITSGGETSKREKAKKIFTNVAIGLVIAAAAFLIIQTVLSIVGYNQSEPWNWFGF